MHGGRLGILCNQAAWHSAKGEYLFETFHKRGNLKRVFLPEHGLFGELQDQVKLEGHSLYSELGLKDCEFVSLYGNEESSLRADKKILLDLDALIIDLQDVGVRYFTYLSTIRNLFITLKEENIPLWVWIIDKNNPAGRGIEGSPLPAEYESFIGIRGLPHRHGLTIGEMAQVFHAELNADFPLTIISKEAVGNAYPWLIPPSPNIPGYYTCDFYSGQCLWEGTNVSEGRGTTRPFEVFGAPWMEKLISFNAKKGLENWNDEGNPLFDKGASLRWHRFIPVYHKFKEEPCFGFQLIRRPGQKYHALLHALRQIRFLKENCEEFAFRPGKYEAGNDKTAIELLAGDPLLLDYLDGKINMIDEIENHLRKTEKEWMERAKNYLLYKEPLFQSL